MAIVIPYVKQTWTDGVSQASAARLGVLEEGILDVSQSPSVHVTHNANQSITSGVVTALAFNTERFDQAGGAASTMHDNVTNNSRLTAIYAGIYLITGNIEWAASPVNSGLTIRLNGVTTIAKVFANVDLRNSNIVTTYSLAVNDYVELMVQQISGGAVNVSSVSNSPEFSMVRVG